MPSQDELERAYKLQMQVNVVRLLTDRPEILPAPMTDLAELYLREHGIQLPEGHHRDLFMGRFRRLILNLEKCGLRVEWRKGKSCNTFYKEIHGWQ